MDFCVAQRNRRRAVASGRVPDNLGRALISTMALHGWVRCSPFIVSRAGRGAARNAGNPKKSVLLHCGNRTVLGARLLRGGWLFLEAARGSEWPASRRVPGFDMRFLTSTFTAGGGLSPSKLGDAEGCCTPDEREAASLLQRANSLSEQILGDNWADYFWLVQNMNFWKAELGRIEELAAPYHEVSQVKEKISFLRRLFDVLCIVEDVRDHLSEVMEQATRSSGIAGTGFNAGPTVSNLGDHAKAAAAVYDDLLVKYPEFSHQIEDVLGMALASLRQKHKFVFSSMHRYFF